MAKRPIFTVSISLFHVSFRSPSEMLTFIHRNETIPLQQDEKNCLQTNVYRQLQLHFRFTLGSS